MAPSFAHHRLLPAYAQLLRQLQQMGAPEVQLHEPSLATDAGASAQAVYETAYKVGAGRTQGCA